MLYITVKDKSKKDYIVSVQNIHLELNIMISD